MSGLAYPPRLAIAALAWAALALLGVAGSADAAAPTLSPTGEPAFPKRSYLLTLPERTRLGVSDVTVTENGGPVQGMRVQSAGAARLRKMGVVLAIDASGSMRGEAFAEAFDAARAFARERDERQPLALVTYGSEIGVPMRFTTDSNRIDRVLGAPGTPSGGTHLYDGVMRGIDLARGSQLPGGVVVVMSDGTDHGSAADFAEVVAAARAARVRVYTIGLKSESFDPAALADLARSTDGRYSEASSPDELNAIYSELGAELSNAHLVTYRSLIGPRQAVEVAADVRGQGIATVKYVSPRLSPQGVGNGAKSGPWDTLPARLIGVCLIAALLGLAVLLFLRRGRRTPRERIQGYVSAATTEPEERVSLTERLGSGADRSLSDSDWWNRFRQDVDLSGLDHSPGALVAIAAGLTLVAAVTIVGLTGQALLMIPVVAAAPFVVRAFLRARVDRQRALFSDQLADHLAVVGGAMRAGHSLPAAFSAVLEDAPQPSQREFGRAVADERLGAPLEVALEDVAERMQSREVEQVALLARLQREVGANGAEMLDRVVDTIRERQSLRRTVRTLTAQGRMSRWILTALPVVVLVFLTVTTPTYADPLYETTLGRVLLVAAALSVTAGSLVIKRIVEFKI